MNHENEIHLDEVTIIRLVLICLLVVYHSFAIYSGAWQKPIGLIENDAYNWIARGSYSFMLEAFVLISGYLWSFQREERGKCQSLKQIIWDKFLRLLLPCYVFSILYILLFDHNKSLFEITLSIFNGAGHLWFLPMLFWCFVFAFPLIQKRYSSWIIWSSVFLLLFFSIIPIPFRISKSFYYLSFFVGGYYLRIYRNSVASSLMRYRFVIWGIFLLLFFVLTIVMTHIRSNMSEDIVNKIVGHELLVFFRFIYSALGVTSIWLSSYYISSRRELSKFARSLGGYCMGVYIFQQFILKYIYYYTDLAIYFGYTILPWVSFLLALLGSLLLSYTVKLL